VTERGIFGGELAQGLADLAPLLQLGQKGRGVFDESDDGGHGV
jgi:hypothetical protein